MKHALTALVIASSTLTVGHFASTYWLKGEDTLRAFAQVHYIDTKAAFLSYTGLKEETPTITASRAEIIAREAHRKGLDPKLVLAVINTESSNQSFRTRYEARLNKGETIDTAMAASSHGLMQILGSWIGHSPCEGITHWSELYNDETNIRCGTAILADAVKRHGKLKPALVEYNSGCTGKKGACSAQALAYADKVLLTYAEAR